MDSNYKRLFFFIILVFLISSIVSGNNFIEYTVEGGDTLSSIAQVHKVSLETLIEVNNIENPNMIVINQVIKIPKKGMYIVKKGDSLWKIAEYIGVKLENLIQSNNILNPDKIFVGQKLRVPENQSREDYQLASRSQNITYIWPVLGRISSEYGWRLHPINKNQHYHTGIDIAVPTGTPVYAAADGIVEYSAWSGGYGFLVIIRHRDNSLTYYGHNYDLLVKEGESVSQGKIIAFSGESGLATGPHLHFEIRKNNKHIDPLIYLNDDYRRKNLRI